MRNYVQSWIGFWLVASVMLIAMLLRLTCAPDIFIDESFYISLPHHLSLGLKPFTEIPGAMHMGGTFVAPLYYLRNIISGGSVDGIFLFSRMLVFFINIMAGILVYQVLRHDVSKRIAAGIALVVAVYVGYPVWFYDTSGSLFLLLCTLFCFAGFQRHRSRQNQYLLFFLSGVAAACMTYSYPPLLISASYMLLVTLIYGLRLFRRSLYSQFMILGIGAVFIAFALYVIYVIGYSNFINGLMAPFGANDTDGMSNAPAVWSLRRPVYFVYVFIKCYAYLLVATVILTIILLIAQYSIFQSTSKWRTVLVLAIISSSLLAYFIKEARIISILASFYTFCGFGIFYLIRQRSEQDTTVLFIFAISALISQFVYGMTSTYGEKEVYGHFSGLIAFSYFSSRLVAEDWKNQRNIKLVSASDISTLIAATLLFSLIMRANFTQNWPDLHSYRHVKAGALRGMLVYNKYDDYITSFDEIWNKHVKGANNVFYGEYHRFAYVTTSSHPFGGDIYHAVTAWDKRGKRIISAVNHWRVADFNGKQNDNIDRYSWKNALKYFERRKALPDLIVVSPQEAQCEEIEIILRKKYQIMYNDDSVEIYQIVTNTSQMRRSLCN